MRYASPLNYQPNEPLQRIACGAHGTPTLGLMNTLPSLESVWQHREEFVFPSLFGPVSRGTFVLSIDLFTNVFRQTDVDPRWLHYGVLEFAPTAHRSSWLYATSGASNPWEQEPQDYGSSQFSGFGTELVLETPTQAQWAVEALARLLAYNILLAHGRFGEVQPLDYGARVPLGGPINGDPASALRLVAIGRADHYDATFSLASGAVDLLHVVGITESERDYAKIHGTVDLIDLLRKTGAFPVTDPARPTAA